MCTHWVKFCCIGTRISDFQGMIFIKIYMKVVSSTTSARLLEELPYRLLVDLYQDAGQHITRKCSWHVLVAQFSLQGYVPLGVHWH